MHLLARSPNPNNLTLTLNAGCPSNYLPVWPAGCLREVFLHAALIVDQVALGWRQREGEREESMYCRVQHRGRCPCQPRALLAARPDPTRHFYYSRGESLSSLAMTLEFHSSADNCDRNRSSEDAEVAKS